MSESSHPVSLTAERTLQPEPGFDGSHEIWRHLVESAPDVLIMVDRQGKILLNNRQPQDTWGQYSLWEDIKTTVIPEHRPRVIETVERVFQTGEPASYELASPTAAGPLCWYMTHLGPFYYQNEIVAVLLMIREITHLKESEEDLNRLNRDLEQRVAERTQALQKSNERLSAISELIPDYVYSAWVLPNGSRRYDWISGALESITGYTVDEMLSGAVAWDALIYPEDRARLCKICSDRPGALEYRLVDRGGKIHWIRDHCKPAETNIPQHGRIWGAVQDITEQKLTEQALQQHTRRLEASLHLYTGLRQAEDRQSALDVLVGHTTQMFAADVGGIYLQELNELVFSSGCGLIHPAPARLSCEGNFLIHQVMNSGQTLFINRVSHKPEHCNFCAFLQQQGVMAVVVAPLRTAQVTLGVLYIGFRHPADFSEQDRQSMDAFAEVGGNTLHRFLVSEQLERNAADRERELAILYEVMSLANITRDPDVLVDQSLERVLAAVGCELGVVNLVNPVTNTLEVVAHRGWSTELCNRVTESPLNGSTHEVFERQMTIQAETLLPPSGSFPAERIAYLGTPIRARGVMIGTLGIFGRPLQLGNLAVVQFVTSISDQLGLAIESARLRKKAEETVVIEERQRLARDLHDSISQSLYGLVLSADVSNKLLKIKDFAGLEETLESIETVALQSLKEMRLMLFELRPLSLETEGLVKALNLRLNTVEHRAGIETSVQISGVERLSLNMELEVYRIATEALNNALKYANASSVRLLLETDEQQVCLQVSDDGDGFEREQTGNGGFGISNMLERARKLNGRLEIHSTPGQGTSICLTAPLDDKRS